MTPEQREAKRARWRRWYEAHPNYPRSHAKPAYARVCPECGESFVTTVINKVCCQRSCTEARWRRNNPESVRLITAAQVRKEEGLDRPKTPHVCHFYPPYYVCLCGKRQSVQTPVMAGD